jgi:excisionase family DNA binding protein
MMAGKNVLTTGDVAKICNVAPRTVSKWFDTGQLRGYRIPGSKDRRIPIDQLMKFMRAHGMPLNGIENGHMRILILDGDDAFAASLKDVLTRIDAFDVATASTALEAGAAATELKPQVVLVDLDMRDVTPKSICRFARGLPNSNAICLIGTAREMSEARGQGLLQDGFQAFLAKPFDVRSLIQLIEQHTAMQTQAVEAQSN